ncbi:MAG: hypothetical protein COY58_01185 [Gammaproteobacteria bacterium CG_4_10_14_0_8_um_filter_38_16]|nr:MAG: hypothetical protein COY58_01185 [Gammaproteobacteria bacterium CG_4_10_14_0_8_um_filter_38_16]PJA03258.1 MAG: hypothetical protein COX72_06185 [Gammaproteobacteria bacterium CG_4_10_14_0_2_um_filter_38_22]PJB09840.1 MAG: hypothetical protein CO120_08020 [Gammaproteobacteria bacterium CG_4_9_14_3_um_filter_38_9]
MQAQFFIDNKPFFSEINEQLKLDIHSIPKPYSVFFDVARNPFDRISSCLIKNNVLFIDANIIKYYQPMLKIASEKIMIVEVNEHLKTLDGVSAVLSFLAKNEVTKNDQLIVVGGGVLQEIGAFSAAMYKRGISYVHFPTTLLSMCDSCIGGKTSLNYLDSKNQLGLYYAPTAVHINTCFLKTVPETEIQSGLGEILKSCIIGGENCLRVYEEKIEKGCIKSFDDYQTLIQIALGIKKSIVEADEFELNYRRSLNYGHTFGHAIEALSEYTIPHGSAIVLGMILENQLSVQHQLMDQATCEKLNNVCFALLSEKSRMIYKKMSFEKILIFLKKDKKANGDSITFSLMRRWGDISFLNLQQSKLYLARFEQID